MSRSKRHNDITLLLLVTLLLLIFLNLQKYKEFETEKPDNIIYDSQSKTLNYKSLTLKQKIAQMVVTFENEGATKDLQNMLIGGIHLRAREQKDEYA
tara:strand:+ start:2217 stop:2507 length:291 start_codon:yes stop_codon:yes gene_type:complete